MEARPPSVAAAPEPAPPPASERPDALAGVVATAVRRLRVAAGLSERAAARLLGTSQTQLRRMEDPRYLPSLRSLARLAAAYDHELRIAFEPRDRPVAKPPKPAPGPKAALAPRPKAAPARARRTPASRPARSGRRGKRH